MIAVAMLYACNGAPGYDAEEAYKQTEAMDVAGAAEPPPPPPPPDGLLDFKGTGSTEESDKEGKETVITANATSTSRTDETTVRIKVPEKIIKTADLRIRTEDYKKSRLAIEKILKSSNAYVSAENEQNSNYSISNNMVIRVLNKDFDNLVNRLTEGAGGEVEIKNIHTDDVTAEFVDIQARLKTKKQVEERYLELLKKAGKITDILEVEEKIRVIREEIEAKEGQLKLLNDQVNYSTINLNFYQTFESGPIDKPGFGNRLSNALGSGWQGFLSFIIGFVYAWPLWIVLGTGGFFLYRFLKRMLKK